VVARRNRNRCCACTFILALAAIGCERENKFVPPPPPKVSVAKPAVGEIADSIEFIGNTRPTATVDLRARVNGYLEKILFEDGATVKEGDVLFSIEQAPFQIALDIAKAELERADADLLLQQTEYRRIEPLVAQQAITQAELDQQRAKLTTAQANILAAQAAVRRAELDLNYTQIRAPIGGRIGRHLVDRGNLVQAEQTLLATIESLDPIHAYFSLSENDLLRFMEMMRAHEIPDPTKNPAVLFLQLANEQGFPHRGHLDFRELGVDASTGTALRRGLFPNPNNELLPGMFVRIRAPIGQPKPRLLVEKRAIGTDQRGNFLLIVNDKNVVEYRLVKLGLSTDGMRVVDEGVKPKEWIVVNGLQRARPGATVEPEQVAMAFDPRSDAGVSQHDGNSKPGQRTRVENAERRQSDVRPTSATSATPQRQSAPQPAANRTSSPPQTQ